MNTFTAYITKYFPTIERTKTSYKEFENYEDALAYAKKELEDAKSAEVDVRVEEDFSGKVLFEEKNY